MKTTLLGGITTIDSDSLVAKLSEPNNRKAWLLADDRYGAAIEGFARTMGLDRSSAEDARQETLVAFASALRAHRFDRSRGRLRDFLFIIAKNKIRDLQRRKARNRRHMVRPDDSQLLARVPSTRTLEMLWDAEWRRVIGHRCLQEVQSQFSPENFRIFRLRVLEELPAARVAELTGKSDNAVNMVVSRIRHHLRRIRPAIEEQY